MSETTAFAPAKINLFLHVGPLAPDGYHPLSSWMVFADVGDRIDALAHGEDVFETEGPFGGAVPRDGSNLVLRARDSIRPDGKTCAIRLTKRLPPASGMGGGSSDAAAALRALGELWDLPRQALELAAPGLGADVPACLWATSLIATGRGEVLVPAPPAPELYAVLVNPGVETATGNVFATYDAGPAGGEGAPDLPERFAGLDDLVGFLLETRNDLELPAASLHPEIVQVLLLLAEQPESRFVRMSGSGATCFALCNSLLEAGEMAMRIQATQPEWWVRPCRLFTSP